MKRGTEGRKEKKELKGWKMEREDRANKEGNWRKVR